MPFSQAVDPSGGGTFSASQVPTEGVSAPSAGTLPDLLVIVYQVLRGWQHRLPPSHSDGASDGSDVWLRPHSLQSLVASKGKIRNEWDAVAALG